MERHAPIEDELLELVARDHEFGKRAEEIADSYRQRTGKVIVPYVFPKDEPKFVYPLNPPSSVWKRLIHSSVLKPLRKRWHKFLFGRRQPVADK